MFGVPTSSVQQDHLSHGLVRHQEMLRTLDIPNKQMLQCVKQSKY